MGVPKPDIVAERLKSRTATMSVAYNICLTLIKLAAAIVTGSVSMMSEALHSLTDVVASFVALMSVKVASRPPDDEHPYGHGKVESLAALAESALLLGIVGYILVEAYHRFVSKAEVANVTAGLVVMGISAVSSYFAARHVSKVGQQVSSIALKSNGQHLMVDFWTSVGVFVALAIGKLTGWQQADSIFAVALGLWIAFGALRMSRSAIDVLIDHKMDLEDEERSDRILKQDNGCLSYHRLRTRTSGNLNYVDVHIVVPREWSVVQAHDVADELEKKIQSELAPAYVVIHVDPFDPQKALSPVKVNDN
ncbi:cation diffusion facilitator family transporter [soil metagenome]